MGDGGTVKRAGKGQGKGERGEDGGILGKDMGEGLGTECNVADLAVTAICQPRHTL